MPSALSRVPALRLLLPMMAGILLHRLWHNWWMPVALIIAAAAAYLLILSKSRTPQGRLRWRPYLIAPIAVCALAAGWLCAVVHCPPHLTVDQRSGRMLTGRVTDLHYTDFSMRMTVEVMNNELPPCRVLLSTRGCDYTMQAGDLVTWQASLNELTDLGNPDEMDYAAYLLDAQGIRYTQHLTLRDVKKTGFSPTLLTRMANTRRDLRLQVFNTDVTSGAKRFVTALLLGDSGMIDKATRQEFATAGVAHVLALSGLHVGFIALIIWWLLFPLDYMRLKKLRLVITLIAITLFAVFTGLSPSVVRATVMIGFVFASLILYRRSVSLNALGMAALGILVFAPSSLYSVGFQLSFITVGAVLLFARVPERLQSRHKWVNNLTATVVTSLVAMLATVALTAHYFHTVSFLSVLANLLILPVLPVFMVVGAVFLLVTAGGLQWNFLDRCIDGIYSYFHWAARTVNAIPMSHAGGVYVSSCGVLLYFAILAFLALWLYRCSYRYLLAAGCTLVLLLAHSIWVDAKTPRQGVIAFNSFTSTPVMYYENGKGYVWTPDDEEQDSALFARIHSGFIARHGIDELTLVPNDSTLRLEGGLFKPPYAHLMGRRWLAVGSGKWKRAVADGALTVNDIVVTKRFNGSASKLRELYRFDRLVISGAMHSTRLTPLLHECDSLGIMVHILSQQGALEVCRK